MKSFYQGVISRIQRENDSLKSNATTNTKYMQAVKVGFIYITTKAQKAEVAKRKALEQRLSIMEWGGGVKHW